MGRGRPKGSKNNKKLSEIIGKPVDLQASTPKEIQPNPLVEQNNNQINKEQDAKLKKVVSDLSKNFGHSVIHLASDEKPREKIEFPVPEVSKMLGGGIPYGSFSVLWGNKSCAKSTIAYNLVAQAQSQGKVCAYFDLENSFDRTWAEKNGIQLDKLLLGHFKTAEEAMDTLIKMSKEKVVDFIVLDSIQSLSPKGEQESKKGKEKSTEDDTMALLARKLSQFFRMAAEGVYSGNVAVLLIGQARTDLGGFIKLETLSGGHALAHWSSLTVKVHRGQKADAPRYKFNVKGKKKELIIGFSLVIKLEKTKISGSAPESTSIRIPFYYEYAFKRPTDEQITDIYKDWIEMEESTEEE